MRSVNEARQLIVSKLNIIPVSVPTQKEVLSHLRSARFDAAAMDLLYGECSLALAHDLGVPAVGFWGSSPVSGQLHHTTLPSNPSFMPFIVTGFSDRMTFAERVVNTGHW